MRIIGGGGLEMARYNNNRGGWNNRGGGRVGEIENSRFLSVNKYLLHIYVNSDVTDSFIFKP